MIYKQLFYTLFQWSGIMERTRFNSKPERVEENTKRTAIFFLSLFELFNIVTIFYYLRLQQLMQLFHSKMYISMVALIIILALNYAYFAKGKRYRSIISEIESKNKENDRELLWGALTFIYIAVSIYLVFKVK